MNADLNVDLFTFCSCSASTNYRLTMHIFGVLTTARSLPNFDQMLRSCAVMFLSPCFGKNVGKHLSKIRRMKTTFTFDSDEDEDESRTDPDDFEVHIQSTFNCSLCVFTLISSCRMSQTQSLSGDTLRKS